MGTTMTYELITPEIAASLLESSYYKRHLSKFFTQLFADEMLAGEWDEATAPPIVIDEDGMLRDGRHRMAAIVRSKVAIHMLVIRNVPRDDMYFKMYEDKYFKMY